MLSFTISYLEEEIFISGGQDSSYLLKFSNANYLLLDNRVEDGWFIENASPGDWHKQLDIQQLGKLIDIEEAAAEIRQEEEAISTVY